MRLAIQPAKISPKLPVGTTKDTFSMRRAERGGAGEIIDGLGKDAREIDRIHAAKIKFIAQRLVIEHVF